MGCRARKVMRKRPEIEVTTRHSYEIEYKYQWSKPATSLFSALWLSSRLFVFRMLELRQDVSLRRPRRFV